MTPAHISSPMKEKSLSTGKVVISVSFIVIIIVSTLCTGIDKDITFSVERLEISTNKHIHDISWLELKDKKYALVCGEEGFLKKYTGKFFLEIESGTADRLTAISWKKNEEKALIVGYNGTILMYDGEKVTKIEHETNDMLEDVAWRPDIDEALIVGHNGTILLYSSGRITKLDPKLKVVFNCVAWRNDGQYALICGNTRIILRYNPSTNTFTEFDNPYEEFIFGIAWSPDDSHALLVGTLGQILVFDGKNFKMLPSPMATRFTDCTYSSDIKSFIVSGNGGLVFQYWLNGSYKIINTETKSIIESITWASSLNCILAVGSGGLFLKIERIKSDNNVEIENDESSDISILYNIFGLISIFIIISVILYVWSKNQKSV